LIVSEPITAGPGHLGLVTRMGDRARLKLIAPDPGAPVRSTLADASIRVLTAAGQRLVRASYRALLERDERIEVVGEAASEHQAFVLAQDTTPDVALLDLGLPGLNDLATGTAIISHPAFDRVAVMLIADRANDERVLSAVRAGAVGVLSRDAEPAELIHAVRLLAGGDALLPVGVVRRLLAERPLSRQLRRGRDQLDELTEREREVVALVATGLSNAEIAAQLVISPATAKTHVSHAMVKLHARDRAKLVVLAYEAGLMPARTHAPHPAERNCLGSDDSSRGSRLADRSMSLGADQVCPARWTWPTFQPAQMAQYSPEGPAGCRERLRGRA
jgi:DNA-binding NarL/FixJ family response regulator